MTDHSCCSHDGGCCSGDHHHHHGHHHECCHHHHDSCCHDHHDFAHELLELADDAWMELLMEKIKKQIEADSGKHLNELAKLISEANHERWKNKIQLAGGSREFRHALERYFSGSRKK